MLHGWNNLTFLHWAYPPEVVQAMLDNLQRLREQGLDVIED